MAAPATAPVETSATGQSSAIIAESTPSTTLMLVSGAVNAPVIPNLPAQSVDAPVKPVDAATIQKRVNRSSKWRPHSPQATMAQTLALMDGISTYAALQNGAVEGNPLMPSSPAGIAAVTLGKMALLELADRKMEPDQRDQLMAVASAVFGGAAVNNTVLAANKGRNSSAAIAAGVVSGVGFYFLNRKIAKNHMLTLTANGVQYSYHKRF